MKYGIQSGTLGHKYAVLITFDDKRSMEPLIRVIKKAFLHFERIRERLERVKELEEEEKRKATTHGGLR